MVNGEKVQRPWAEVRQTQAMLPAAFTQKTQALAEERRAFAAEQQRLQDLEARLQSREQRWQQQVTDPDILASLYLAALAKRNGAPPPAAPGAAPQGVAPGAMPAPFSLDDVRAAVRQSYEEARQQAAQEAFQAQRLQAIEQDLGAFGQGLMKDTPLARLKGADDLVWNSVFKMQPANPAEAKEYAKLVVADFNRQLVGEQQTAVARAAVAQAKGTAGIEPAGGAPATPQPRKYNDLQDSRLSEDMAAFMAQRLGAE